MWHMDNGTSLSARGSRVVVCCDVDEGAPGHAGFPITLNGSVQLQRYGRSDSSKTAAPSGWHSWGCGCLAAAALCVTACAVGPDYHKPTVQMPESFKEGTEWQRAQANPQGALSSTWWVEYHDEQLSQLVDAALQANQSIVAAEAAYRVAQATVSASVAALYPTVSARVSATRAQAVPGAAATELPVGVSHFVSATATASWELDLWGQTRRQIESSKAGAQAIDAQRAGQRLSIAASVASDYFALRQADIDIDFLKQQQQVNANILTMTQAGYAQGAASGDDVLVAQDTLEAVIAALQATLTLREQYEHAIAVLVGVPPGGFSIQPRQDYVFVTPP